ncbi:hypothetical protein [Burkholderia ubonensis]|uniref:hypothetical protein n=1 Tax=Burkholderia ubonensis TaxID=101571 RepID=UPI00075AFC36|nr:hypothetical protein [Burkholderia ubonensis]KWC13774.1 hypothetical protein WL46_02900 [Burkholderia ubonensis]
MVIQQLRDELRAAHTIIRNALGVMTFDQKLQWANANERNDAIGEGVTRANERQAVIDDGSPRALFVELRRADLIIANAWEIQSFHQHALWTTSNLQDGVAANHPTRADSRAIALAAAVEAAHELAGDASGSTADAIVGYVKCLGDVAPDAQPAIAQAAEPLAIPAGWRVVPEKITRAMIESAMECHYGKRRARQNGGAGGIVMTVNDTDWTGVDAMRRFWKGALAAAPKPSAHIAARAALREPTGDEVRAAIKSVPNFGTNHGDAPLEYVLAGWRAAMGALLAAHPGQPTQGA